MSDAASTIAGLLPEDSPVQDFVSVFDTVENALQAAQAFGITLPDSMASSAALLPYTETGSIATALAEAGGFSTAAQGSQAWQLAQQTKEFGEAGVQATAEALGSTPGKISAFLKSPVGGGLAAAALVGVTTGDWKAASYTGIGTAIGNVMFPGIGGVIGGVLGGLATPDVKPSRPRFGITYDPANDKTTQIAGARTYSGSAISQIQSFIETQGKNTERMLEALGLEETAQKFVFGTRQGTTHVSGGDVDANLSGSTQTYLMSNPDVRYFGAIGERDTQASKETFAAGLAELQEEVIRTSAIEHGGNMGRYAQTFIGDTQELILGLAKVKSMTFEEADAWLTEIEAGRFEERDTQLTANIESNYWARADTRTGERPENYMDYTGNQGYQPFYALLNIPQLQKARQTLADMFGQEYVPVERPVPQPVEEPAQQNSFAAFRDQIYGDR